MSGEVGNETRNVIWLASYPKSGNTWLKRVLEVAARRSGSSESVYEPYASKAEEAQLPAYPFVAAQFAAHPCSLLKTHSAFNSAGQPHQFPGLDLVTAGFINIYRNPLDVLLSYISFTRLEYAAMAGDARYQTQLFCDLLGFKHPFGLDEWRGMGIDGVPRANLDYALDYFSDYGLTIPTLQALAGSWQENVQSWLSAGDHVKGYCMRYEDCLFDENSFGRISDLFSFEPETINAASRAVMAATKDIAVAGSGQQKMFFNKMRAYYFVEYFSESAIQRFFRNNEEVLRSFGYGAMMDDPIHNLKSVPGGGT